MAWCINNGNLVLGRFKLPQCDINSDTTFSLGLELVEYPSVLERTFSHVGGFLLKLFDGSLVDTTAFVDQMSGTGGLASVDVTNNDNVDVGFCLAHGRRKAE